MIKGLSLLYFVMSMIGFLGYLELEKYSTNIFSFFNTILGSYSILLPFLCLIFTLVCWRLSKISQKVEEKKSNLTNSQHYKGMPLRQENIEISEETVVFDNNGFASYFADMLPIIDHRVISSNDYNSLGFNFSTYFGKGKKNIYLPSKAVTINGFREFFKDGKSN